MAEYIANTVQTVPVNQNVLFTDTTVCGNNSIVHRAGSGLITLRGITINAAQDLKSLLVVILQYQHQVQ